MEDPMILEGIAFRSESRQRLKTLSAYDKAAAKRNDRFSPEMVKPEVLTDIETCFAALRSSFQLKRKDVQVSTFDEGEGDISIATPHFDYAVRVSLDEADPSCVLWQREVRHVRQPAVLESDAFRTVFGERFDTLLYPFTTAVDVAALIDRVEADETGQVSVDYPFDSAWCEIQLKGHPVVIRVVADRMEIQSRGQLSSADLYRIFQQIQGLVAPAQIAR